jgi:branched-chain amino acid transport system ATP-binding protein
MPMLEVAGLSFAYGKHRALSDIALNVARGEIVAILGANGAGKTTLLKAIAGLLRPMPGAKRSLDGRSLDGLEPREIVEAGVALVPRGGIFSELTVRVNLGLGALPKAPGPKPNPRLCSDAVSLRERS